MILYFTMIIVAMAFASYGMLLNKTYTLKFEKAGKIITIKQSRIFMFLSFATLALVSALRYQVGVDYNSYVWLFDAVKQGSVIHAETGYRLLNEAILLFSDNAQYVFVITSIIIFALVFYGIYKNSVNPALSIFLFVTMGYMFSSFNILRQYIAIAIIFVAFKYIKENKFIPFLIFVLVAVFFHKTAIIMIPFYFIVRLRFKHSYLMMITLVGLGFIPLRGVLTNLLVSIFYPQYAGTNLITPLSLSELAYYAGVFGFAVILCLAYKNQFFKDDENLILFNCAFFSFILYMCFSFVPEINRIAVYLELYIILLIPKLIQLEQNPKTKRLLTYLIVVGFSLFCFLTVGLMGRFQVVPYTSIFSK